MTCTHCGHEFCWVCLSSNWSDHNCNVYEELEQQDENRRARFFSQRVNVHRRSELFARESLQKVGGTMEAIAEKLHVEDEEEAQNILEFAMKTLVDARGFLLNSYIAAFGLNRDDVYKEEFETHQAQVELLTERLSLLTENIHAVFEPGEAQQLRSRFQAIMLTGGALALYIRRIDLFMSNVMSLKEDETTAALESKNNATTKSRDI